MCAATNFESKRRESVDNLYYINCAGEVAGPVSQSSLESLHQAGEISGLTAICREGDDEWVPYYRATEEGYLKQNLARDRNPKSILDTRRKGLVAAASLVLLLFGAGVITLLIFLPAELKLKREEEVARTNFNGLRDEHRHQAGVKKKARDTIAKKAADGKGVSDGVSYAMRKRGKPTADELYRMQYASCKAALFENPELDTSAFFKYYKEGFIRGYEASENVDRIRSTAF